MSDKPQTTKPLCPRCRRSGFTRSVASDGRPKFTCQACEHVWTSGHSGGVYAGHEQWSATND